MFSVCVSGNLLECDSGIESSSTYCHISVVKVQLFVARESCTGESLCTVVCFRRKAFSLTA